MTELATLARPYAQAAFKRAQETNSTTQWANDLALMSSVLSTPEMIEIVNHPKIQREQLVGWIKDSISDKIAVESANFLNLLIHNKRTNLLPDISTIYQQLKAENEGYVEVIVTSAYPFTPAEIENFSATLKKSLNKQVHLKVTVDKSLIGGVLVRMGDQVIDGSVRGQLQQLQKALL